MTNSGISESELRDLLAKQLAVLEPGLSLIKKEQYVPSSIGTRGFIDLFARDRDGHFVLIELKRSDAAAREAIHEVLKYAEGVKRHLGVLDHELRLFIASTEWRELSIPFSRLVSESKLSIAGFELSVSTATNQIEATKVEPLKITRGRLIAPWHELNFYSNEKSLEAGIASYKASCATKQIEDYVMLVLDAPDGFNEMAKSQLRESLRQVQERFGSVDEKDIDDKVSKLREIRSAIYFGMQMLDAPSCLAIIERAKGTADKAALLETINGMEEEEALCHLHETIGDLPPRPHRDGFEIAYPAKLHSRLLESEQWRIREIQRAGIFKRNQLLTDEAIVEELCGSDGVTGQRFKRTISLSNPAHVASAKSDLAGCLSANPAWRAHTARHLDDLAKDFPKAEAQISVYNPSAGLMTLFHSLTSERGVLFVPMYNIAALENGAPRRVYYGCLVGYKDPQSFQSIIGKFYEGQIFGLLLTNTWGGYEVRDTDILDAVGLRYRSFRADIDGDNREFFLLDDTHWISTEFVNPLTSLFEHLSKHEEFVSDLVDEIGSRQAPGGFEDDSSGEHALAAVADEEEASRRNKYWIGEVDRCDLCRHDLLNDKYMVDGKTKMGLWACMCSKCFSEAGVRIGWGYGQLYKRTTEGWLQVGGFNPSPED